VARGHQVTATTTSVARLRLLEQLGAGGVVMDGLDAVSVKEAVASARPDAIVHEMTALSGACQVFCVSKVVLVIGMG
jgi:nucleoside-diphosphate-sugar epimerase